MVMTTQQQQQVKDSSVIVEQELKRINAQQLVAAIQNASSTLMSLGAIEIVLGVVTVFLASFAGALFVALLGGAVLISGLLNIVSSVVQDSGARMTFGVVAAIAGLLILGHPLFGFSFLTSLVGIYFIVSGIVRFFEAKRSSWKTISGIAHIVFGIIMLASLPAASAGLMGLLVGIGLIVNGIVNTSTSSSMAGGIRPAGM